jgi:hypothetical protein
MNMAANAAPLAGASRSTGAPPVFVARGLTKSYGSGDATVYALLGPSGSGKSTLLNILGGLDVPSAGRAAWRDHELTGADEAALTAYRRDHVGFVFQFYNLIPSLTARENVALVAEIARNPMPAEEALALVGLSRSALRWHAPSSSGRMPCFAMNPPARLMSKQASSCFPPLRARTERLARPPSSSRITLQSLAWRTGYCAWGAGASFRLNATRAALRLRIWSGEDAGPQIAP